MRWLAAGLVLAVVVAVALAAALRHQQQQVDDFGRESTRRLDQAVSQTDASLARASEALGLAQGLNGRIDRLEQSLQRIEQQQQAQEAFYRAMVQDSDEALLIDVEQSLLLAQEQLELAGRVPNAIAALQRAESRLERAGRPGLVVLRQALAQDRQRLLSLDVPDSQALAQRVTRLIQATETLPMAWLPESPGHRAPKEGADEREEAAAGAVIDPNAPWWEQWQARISGWAGQVQSTITEELSGLVRIDRIDDAQSQMLTPEAGALLRAGLVLRLVEARMALLGRDAEQWRLALDDVAALVARHIDASTDAGRRYMRELTSLRDIDPSPDLPTLDGSLNAVRGLLSRGTDDAHAAPVTADQEG